MTETYFIWVLHQEGPPSLILIDGEDPFAAQERAAKVDGVTPDDVLFLVLIPAYVFTSEPLQAILTLPREMLLPRDVVLGWCQQPLPSEESVQ